MTTSRVQQLTKRELISPPPFVPGSVQYEVIMGSEAYGVSSGDSDRDVYGFCVPPKSVVFPHTAGEILGFGRQKKRFDQYQQHHIVDEVTMGGTGVEYDFAIYNIVKYFQLCLENNPNMIDSLFVPQRCVLYITKIGHMVREERRTFLHKGSWFKLKGYAFSQMKKMFNKNPELGSKRYEDVQKHGYDCYDDATTEFLTTRGWLSYDDIHDNDELATLNTNTECVEFQTYLKREAVWRDVALVQLDTYNSRCIITPRHRVLVSPARRNPATNYSYQYFPDKKDWRLVAFEDLYNAKRSWYHIRKGAEPRQEEYDVEDWYLQLSGLYLSDGTMAFRDGQVKCARLTQTEQGCYEFFELADQLMSAVDMRKYAYEPQTIWHVNRTAAERLLEDYGHGAKEKKLPNWTLHLSARQALLLWESMVFGDGTSAPNGQVLYTASQQLAASTQAMMVSSGFVSTVRGPYWTDSDFGACDMYQVYLPDTQARVSAISIRRELDLSKEVEDKKKGYNIKRHPKQNRRVVCFEVPNGTLVTRNHGRVAIQGNCKFGYHVVRLLNQAEEVLTEHNLTLDRNREQLKDIRAGNWTAERIKEYFEQKEASLETVYTNSTLRHGPDEEAIKTLLLRCLEEYYGSLEKCVVVPDAERQALREIDAALAKVRHRI